MFILIYIFAVNELQGYFVITAFNSDNIAFLSYLILTRAHRAERQIHVLNPFSTGMKSELYAILPTANFQVH